MNSIPPSVTDQSVPDQKNQSLPGQMAALYAFVDDYLKAHPGQAQWRLSPNSASAAPPPSPTTRWSPLG